jgi:2'-5' RNA ligase
VSGWRQQFDPAASAGVPAHVTVLYPFRTPDRLDDDTLRAVGEVARSVASFRVAFKEPASWPGVVWLRPEPDEGFRALTEAAVARFPDCVPYGGQFDDAIPHLTVGQDLDEHRAAQAIREMTEGLRVKPIELTVRELALYTSDPAGEWTRQRVWSLG